jgi:hypothetical protein
MPKVHHHKKHAHKGARRKRARGHEHLTAHAKHSPSHRARHHRSESHHEHLGSFPDALRKKLDRPVTVKTLKDIVALRRVQRGG